LPADHPDKHLELGSEPTPDEFVAALLEVFGGRDNPVGVWRVLRDDGCCFVDLGDAYASSGGCGKQGETGQRANRRFTFERPGGTRLVGAGLKYRLRQNLTPKQVNPLAPKNLIGTPWRLALALQAAGWYWRDTICYQKASPMPGSQRDRCTSSWEPVLMMTKKSTYHWDMEAARELGTDSSAKRLLQDIENQQGSDRANAGGKTNGPLKAVGDGNTRIPRNVWRLDWDEDDVIALLNYLNAQPADGNLWKISSEGTGLSHYAVFPKALPAKIITACTSERGCCPTCGAPFVRITDSERVATRPGNNSKIAHVGDLDSYGRNRTLDATVGHRDPGRHVTATTTLGWRPGCTCCRACDIIRSSTLKGDDDGTQRQGGRISMEATVEPEAMAGERRAQAEGGGTEAQTRGDVQTMRHRFHGKEGGKVLQPEVQRQMDVGDGAAKSVCDICNESLQDEEGEREDAVRASAIDRATPKTAAGGARACAPYQRRPSGQSARESRGATGEDAQTAAHEQTKGHRLEPYEPVPCRVIDPFAGAGTSALAAMGLQRHCTLIELSETYCEMIVARLRAGLYATSAKRNDAPGQLTLFSEAEV